VLIHTDVNIESTLNAEHNNDITRLAPAKNWPNILKNAEQRKCKYSTNRGIKTYFFIASQAIFLKQYAQYFSSKSAKIATFKNRVYSK